MASMSYTGNLRSSPAWLGDFTNREHVLPVPAKLDPAQFATSAGVTVTTSGTASQSATSIPVTALSYGPSASTSLISQGNVVLPSGTVLYFGGAKIATLTADAVYGATTLTVAALPTALASGDVANFSPFGTLFVPSGTQVGRTYAERDASTPYGPAAITDDEFFLILNDVVDARRNNDIELVRHGSEIKENYLPNYTTLTAASADVQTVTITGTPTGGTFLLSYKGATTTALAFNASTATVQTALQALSTIGSGNATVTGSAGTSYVVTFVAALSPTDLLALNTGGLTGGTPGGSVARTGTGSTGILGKLRSVYRCVVGKD